MLDGKAHMVGHYTMGHIRITHTTLERLHTILGSKYLHYQIHIATYNRTYIRTISIVVDILFFHLSFH